MDGITPTAYARQRTFTLVVPAGNGESSPRAVVRPESDDASDGTDRVGRCRVHVVSGPAGFVLKCDKLKPGGDAATDAHWRANVDSNTDTGELPEQDFNFHAGVGFRGVSAGTGGDLVIDVTWEARA
jgi:hypothetical protein